MPRSGVLRRALETTVLTVHVHAALFHAATRKNLETQPPSELKGQWVRRSKSGISPNPALNLKVVLSNHGTSGNMSLQLLWSGESESIHKNAKNANHLMQSGNTFTTLTKDLASNWSILWSLDGLESIHGPR